MTNDDRPLTWDTVPASVWLPNALAGAIGATIALVALTLIAARLGVSRSATGLVGEVTEFLRGC